MQRRIVVMEAISLQSLSGRCCDLAPHIEHVFLYDPAGESGSDLE